MKKNHKIFLAIILFCMVTMLVSNITLATTINDLNAPARTDFNDAGNSAIKVLSTIGMIVSVIALVIIGIKYMLGSTEDRAEYKKSLLPYIIGAILVFAASSIASIVYNVAKDM